MIHVLLVAFGALLAATPFVVVTVFGAKTLGVRSMVGIWAITFAIIGAIIGGFALMGAS